MNYFCKKNKRLLDRTRKHINSFDFFKALIVSVLLATPVYWGFSTGNYPQGISFLVGVMFAYFANIEGTNRNRLIGMCYSFGLGVIVLIIFFSISEWPTYLKLAIYALIIFSSSMLSVFGNRGSMIGFSGLFSIVMGFMLHNLIIEPIEVFKFVSFGGFTYILIASVSHFLFQKRHISLLLAECVELTTKYLKTSDAIKWKTEENSPDLQYQLLKTQSAINENHELLRSLLMNENSYLINNNESRKLYLLFIEMVDIYEMAIASNPDIDTFEEELGEHIGLLEPFKEISGKINNALENLSDALRKNGEFQIEIDINEFLKIGENSISVFVEKVKLPIAREGALMIRNLLDHKHKQLEKLRLLDRTYNNLRDETQLIAKRNSQFITAQDYSFNTIKINSNTDSVIFRHSIRLTVAFLLSFFIGNALDPAFTNWIIMTTMVILRPNYGLTKSRAKNRMLGTLIGMVLTLAFIYLFDDRTLLGSIAVITLLVGFSYINKSYKIASAGITISVLLLYVLNDKGTFNLVLDRGYYTFIGVLISLFSMYFIWPVWEKENVKEAIKNAIAANLNYLIAANSLYKSKELADTSYRLIRKEAFIKNGNLNAAFQRMQDEPKSKKNLLSNVYAGVLLNHSFLSAVAAYSAYIQSHKTTETSEQFDSIMKFVCLNLNNSIATIDKKDLVDNPDNTQKSLDMLIQKYADLNEKRNQEIESGKTTMSLEMRNKLQEAKVIIEQLKWFINLSENLFGAVRVLG